MKISQTVTELWGIQEYFLKKKTWKKLIKGARSLDLILIPLKLHEDISQMVTDLWGVQEFLGKNNQKGITWKLRKGEQPF